MAYLYVLAVTFLIAAFHESARAEVLHAKYVNEGPCIEPEVLTYINPQLFNNKNYLMPLANEYAYRSYAESLLGRPANDMDELEKMCINFDAKAAITVTRGFDNIKMEQVGSYIAKGAKIRVNITQADPGTKPEIFADYVDNIVWTDNESSFLIVRCVNGFRDYKLISTAPTVPYKLLTEIRENITRMGFEPRYFMQLHCNKPKTEE